MKDRIEPASLREHFVAEIGIRQALPYLTFVSDEVDTSAELRLYIDSTFTVTSASADLGTSDPGTSDPGTSDLGTSEKDDEKLWLLRLTEVLDLTVRDVTVDDDANLVVGFHNDVFLRVSGHGAPWTRHDVWWLISL